MPKIDKFDYVIDIVELKKLKSKSAMHLAFWKDLFPENPLSYTFTGLFADLEAQLLPTSDNVNKYIESAELLSNENLLPIRSRYYSNLSGIKYSALCQKHFVNTFPEKNINQLNKIVTDMSSLVVSCVDLDDVALESQFTDNVKFSNIPIKSIVVKRGQSNLIDIILSNKMGSSRTAYLVGKKIDEAQDDYGIFYVFNNELISFSSRCYNFPNFQGLPIKNSKPHKVGNDSSTFISNVHSDLVEIITKDLGKKQEGKKVEKFDFSIDIEAQNDFSLFEVLNDNKNYGFRVRNRGNGDVVFYGKINSPSLDFGSNIFSIDGTNIFNINPTPNLVDNFLI